MKYTSKNQIDLLRVIELPGEAIKSLPTIKHLSYEQKFIKIYYKLS